MEGEIRKYGLGHFGYHDDSSSLDGSIREPSRGGARLLNGRSPYKIPSGKIGGVEAQADKKARLAEPSDRTTRSKRAERLPSHIIFGSATAASRSHLSRRPLPKGSLNIDDEDVVTVSHHHHEPERRGTSSTANKGKGRASTERSRSPQKPQPLLPSNSQHSSSEEEVEHVEPRENALNQAGPSRSNHNNVTSKARAEPITKSLGTTQRAKPIGSTNGELRGNLRQKNAQSTDVLSSGAPKAGAASRKIKPNHGQETVPSSNLPVSPPISSNISNMFIYIGEGEPVVAHKIPTHLAFGETANRGAACVCIRGPDLDFRLPVNKISSLQYHVGEKRSFILMNLSKAGHVDFVQHLKRHSHDFNTMLLDTQYHVFLDFKAGSQQHVTFISRACEEVRPRIKIQADRGPEAMSAMYQQLLQRHQEGSEQHVYGKRTSALPTSTTKRSSKESRPIVVPDSDSESAKDDYSPSSNGKKRTKLAKKKEQPVDQGDKANQNGQRDIKSYWEKPAPTRTSKRIKDKASNIDSSAIAGQEDDALERSADHEITVRPQRHVPRPPDPQAVLFPYPLNGPARLTITAGDKYRLPSDDFLNDTLLEFGLSHVIEEARGKSQKIPGSSDEVEGTFEVGRDVHLFNSFFYERLQTRAAELGSLDSAIDDNGDWLPYKSVSKWTKTAEIFKKRLVIVPINEHAHWYLAIIWNPAGILRKCSEEHVTTRDTDQDAAAHTPAPEANAQSSESGPEGDEEEEEEEDVEGRKPDPTSTRAIDRSFPLSERGDHDGSPAQGSRIVSDCPSNLVSNRAASPDPIDSFLEVLSRPNAIHKRDDPSVSEATRRLSAASLSSAPSKPSMDGDDAQEDVDMERGAETERIAALEPAMPPGVEGRPFTIPAQRFYGTRGALEAERASLIAEDDSQVAASFGPETSRSVPTWDEFTSKPETKRTILGSDETWIITLDSLGGGHRPVTDILGRWLVSEARARQNVDLSVRGAHHRSREASVPLQPNFSDCGLYLIHFTERLVNDLSAVLGFIELERRKFTHQSGHHKRYQDLLHTVWDAKATSGLRDLWTGKIDSLASEYGRNHVKHAGAQDPSGVDSHDAHLDSQEGDSIRIVDAEGFDLAEGGNPPAPSAAEAAQLDGDVGSKEFRVGGNREKGQVAPSNPFHLLESGGAEEGSVAAPSQDVVPETGVAESGDEEVEPVEHCEPLSQSAAHEAETVKLGVDPRSALFDASHPAGVDAAETSNDDNSDVDGCEKVTSSPGIDEETLSSNDRAGSSPSPDRVGEPQRSASVLDEERLGTAAFADTRDALDDAVSNDRPDTQPMFVSAPYIAPRTHSIQPGTPTTHRATTIDLSQEDLHSAQRDVDMIQNPIPSIGATATSETLSSPLFNAMNLNDSLIQDPDDCADKSLESSAGIRNTDARASNFDTETSAANTTHSTHHDVASDRRSDHVQTPDLLAEATQDLRPQRLSQGAATPIWAESNNPSIPARNLDPSNVAENVRIIMSTSMNGSGVMSNGPTVAHDNAESALDRLQQPTSKNSQDGPFGAESSSSGAKRPMPSQSESGRGRKRSKRHAKASQEPANAPRRPASSSRITDHDESEVDLGEVIPRGGSIGIYEPADVPQERQHGHLVDEDVGKDGLQGSGSRRRGRQTRQVNGMAARADPSAVGDHQQAQRISPDPRRHAQTTPGGTDAESPARNIEMIYSDDSEDTGLHPALTSAHKLNHSTRRSGKVTLASTTKAPPTSFASGIPPRKVERSDSESVMGLSPTTQVRQGQKVYSRSQTAKNRTTGAKHISASDGHTAFSGSDISTVPLSTATLRTSNAPLSTPVTSRREAGNGRDHFVSSGQLPIATGVSPDRRHANGNGIYEVSSDEDDGQVATSKAVHKKRVATQTPQRSGKQAKRYKDGLQQSTLPASHTPHTKGDSKRPATSPNATDQHVAKKGGKKGRRDGPQLEPTPHRSLQGRARENGQGSGRSRDEAVDIDDGDDDGDE